MAQRHNSQRRSLLKIIASSAIAGGMSIPLIACTHKKFFNPDENILLSGGSYTDNEKTQNALIIINLTQKEKRVIDTPFLPHQVIINPNNKHSVYCFEKKGNNGCEVNLQTQKTERTFYSTEGHLFSGHACFSGDGKQIICIESNTDNQQGNISLRDTKTLKITQQQPTLGLSPHDCQLKNETLTVSNTGRSESGFHQPSLVRINLKTEKLLERIKLDEKNATNKNLNCGHFKTSTNNDLVIASAPINNHDKVFSGGVSIGKKGEDIITMVKPDVVIKRMTGEALSIEINQQRSIAAITHPEANLLTFWSIKNRQIIKAFGMENPRGLSQTIDKKHFIVSYGNKPAMVNISTADLLPQADSIIQPTLASGEHIINWSKALRQIMPSRIYD